MSFLPVSSPLFLFLLFWCCCMDTGGRFEWMGQLVHETKEMEFPVCTLPDMVQFFYGPGMGMLIYGILGLYIRSGTPRHRPI